MKTKIFDIISVLLIVGIFITGLLIDGNVISEAVAIWTILLSIAFIILRVILRK